MPRLRDLTGQRFGRLLVVARAANINGRGAWLVRCDCGREKVSPSRFMTQGRAVSCGCWGQRDRLLGQTWTTRHGHSRRTGNTPEYECWCHMRRRCYDANGKDYKNYGGRGIAVCHAWRESFEAFYRDMGPRPSPTHSIDRINNDGHYEPGNCRWADRLTQNRNRRQVTSPLSSRTARDTGRCNPESAQP